MTAALPSKSDKSRFVATMFGRIARRYDLMNTLMTGGRDAAWRRLVAEDVVQGRPSRVLDVGTGTGRLRDAIVDRQPLATVVGVDFAEPMLRAASRASGLAAGDALRLPFADASFDAVVSGFVVRNLADRQLGLAEQVRVLRPGGQIVILETTPGPGGVLGVLSRVYFRRVVPLLGRLVAGDAAAYTYLPESTVAFLQPERLVEELRRVGVTNTSIRRLAFGAVAITRGYSPSRAEL